MYLIGNVTYRICIIGNVTEPNILAMLLTALLQKVEWHKVEWQKVENS